MESVKLGKPRADDDVPLTIRHPTVSPNSPIPANPFHPFHFPRLNSNPLKCLSTLVLRIRGAPSAPRVRRFPSRLFGATIHGTNCNMTNDGINTLTYDAENHVVSSTSGSGSGTYTYDGNGQRVIKVGGSNTIVTIFAGAQVLAEYYNGAAPSAPTNEYIYAGSLKVASIQSGGTNYWHNDHLSPRVRTDTSGNVSDERGTFPFGETWYSPGASPYMYTTYYRDYEASGNDYAQARTYAGGLGRFSSPDPISGSTSDPQSLNRYSYVRNMPVMFADPFGTCPPVVENRDPDKNQSQDSESGGGPYIVDFSDPAAPDPEAPPQGTPGGCGTPPWYYTMGGGGGDGALGGGTGGGLVSIDGGEGFAPGDGGWGLTGIGTDPFSILDAAFTPTSYQTVDNPDCPNGDCPGGVGDESITVPVYGNLGLLSLLGGPAGDDLIGNTLKRLQRLLKLDQKCSAFLNGGGTDVQAELAGVIDKHLYGQTEIVPTKNANGTLTMNNAISFGYIPGQAITVNTIGAFFNATYQGLPLTTDRGRISGGTPVAQGFILLHELGHLTDALNPDFNKQKVIDQNDKALEVHCKDLIKALSK